MVNPLQSGLTSMVYKFFDKKSALFDKSKGSGIVPNEPNYQLANELHKPNIRKFKKRKVYLSKDEGSRIKYGLIKAVNFIIIPLKIF